MALSLSSYTYTSFVGKFVPGLIYLYQQSSEASSLFFRAFDEGFKRVISDEGGIFLKNALMGRLNLELSALKYAPVGLVSVLDVFNLSESKQNSNQNDGTIAAGPEIYSHTSFTGVIRLYMLVGSILAIVYGLRKGYPTLVNYGISTLPLAVSMYVRDDQSGGLLQRVLDRWKNPNPSRLIPQPQTVQVSNQTSA